MNIFKTAIFSRLPSKWWSKFAALPNLCFFSSIMLNSFEQQMVTMRIRSWLWIFVLCISLLKLSQCSFSVVLIVLLNFVSTIHCYFLTPSKHSWNVSECAVCYIFSVQQKLPPVMEPKVHGSWLSFLQCIVLCSRLSFTWACKCVQGFREGRHHAMSGRLGPGLLRWRSQGQKLQVARSCFLVPTQQ